MAMLSDRYPLAIDSDIVYDDVSHSYGLRSRPGIPFTSVTAVAGSRMPQFNAAVVSAKLAQAGRGKYAGQSADAIRQSWKDAATLGTALHAEIENFYNGGVLPPHRGFLRTARMLSDVLGLEPWRSELKMASANSRIAGTADMIFKRKGRPVTDGVVIVDWKRTEEAPRFSKYDQCRRELAHLPAGKFWKFALQINLYAHLLLDTCGVVASDMFIVLLHPSGETSEILRVPSMPEAKLIYRHPK